MPLFTSRLGIATIITAVIVLAISLFTAPGVYNHYRIVTSGLTYDQLLRGGASIAQAKELALATGIRSALLMILGQHIPMTIFLLVAVGLVSKSTTAELRRKLRTLYIVVSVIGIPVFALGSSYWAQGNQQFIVQLLIAAAIYLAFSAIVWLLIGIGVAVRGKDKAANAHASDIISHH